MQAKILVIDDSIVSTQFFKTVLEGEDHMVAVSHDGKNVMELIDAHGIDVVLLDVIMPEANGYDILSSLQKSERTKDIPVVMITNLTSPQEVKKALEYGALDFIRKSCEPIEVIARVNSAVRLKHKQDQLKESACRDPLTRLYNKEFFNVTLEKLMRNRSQYYKGISLLLLDCDFFKRINDNYGHMAGDEVLAAVSNAIVKSVKTTDIACRFGGEEFCLISPNSTSFQAFAIAERIRKNVEKMSFRFGDQKVSITISCGVSHAAGDDGKSDSTLVQEADAALYAAKRNGRNQTIPFSSEM